MFSRSNVVHYVISIICISYVIAVDEICVTQNKALNNNAKADDFSKEHIFINESRTSVQLTWGGDNSGVIVIVFNDKKLPSTIYRSDANGVKFGNITGSLDNKNPIHVRSLNGLHRNAQDKSHLILSCFDPSRTSDHTIFFSSQDSGATWTKSETVFDSAETLKFHTSNHPEYILNADIKKNLWISQDRALHWTKIQESVSQYEWSVLSEDAFSTIYITADDLSGKTNLQKSSDFGKTWVTIFSNVQTFVAKDNLFYVSQVDATLKGKKRLFVMTAKNQTFSKVHLPALTKNEFYSVLEVDNDMAFVHVDEVGNTGKGNLYMSDSTGLVFSESLENLFYPENLVNVPDFYHVLSMRGTYIANILLPDRSTASVISHNRGATWYRIPKPTNIQCVPVNGVPCSLHISNTYSLVNKVNATMPLSSPTAVGIILAHGHVGHALRTSDADVFVSSDGGYSWIKSLDGPHHYAILNHGALLVAMPKAPTITILKFSTDEGRCWHTYNLTNKASVFLQGLHTEPGNKALSVAIWGYSVNSSKHVQWEVTVTDFSKLINKKCDAKQDYIEWTPHSETTDSTEPQFNGCLLGVKEKFHRLKKDTLCLQDYHYKPVGEQSLCSCSKMDFECDFGYSRKFNEFECKRSPLIKEADLCKEGWEDQRYRKIPGDKCTGGFQPDNVKVACGQVTPNAQVRTGSSIGGALLAFICVVCVLVAVVLVYRQHRVRRRLASLRYSFLTAGDSNFNEDSALLTDGNDPEVGDLEGNHLGHLAIGERDVGLLVDPGDEVEIRGKPVSSSGYQQFTNGHEVDEESDVELIN